MLTGLSIRNFAVIEDVRLEFDGALTALTGESGAGKSMVVDALMLALGERADADAVRAGATRAEVSASFDLRDNADLRAALADAGLDAGDQCILRRTVSADGRSRSYVNDQPVAAGRMREIGQQLIEIHGQHAYQALLRPDDQLRLLDRYAGAQDLARAVAAAAADLAAARAALAGADADAAARAARRDELAVQCAALDALGLAPGEWARLETEQSRLGHVEALLAGAGEALALLDDSDAPCAGALTARAGQVVARLAALDGALAPLADELAGALAQLRAVASSLRHYADTLEADPQRARLVDERLREGLALARRYGVDPPALPDLHARVRADLAALDDPGASPAALVERCAQAQAHYRTLASELSARRSAAAARLEAAVNAELAQLGMADARFVAALQALPEEPPSARGAERLELRLAPHPGATALPLGRVASGGELSRLSLAIEVAALAQGGVPTVVLDEVDVGIGGQTAVVVGRMLQRLAGGRQVLCVTHLAQVAAHAHHHVRVVRDAGTHPPSATVEPLHDAERVAELARMLGGRGPAARAHAVELLAACAAGAA